jgi:hypothetical protein|tara:strand:+ start:506 stop:1216 length:711 start_codon:yes stop_codon:yes gene_type:complete
MAGKDDKVPASAPATDAEVRAFLGKVAQVPPAGAGSGRLIFAMDATASREPSWDTACDIQAEMFSTTAAIGRLQVQLAYYRGFQEFHASPFVDDAEALARRMCAVTCRGGRTQIGRVLRHAAAENAGQKVSALVFAGDACEEKVDSLCHGAGELGLRGVPAFIFHEGADAQAGRVFKEIARLSGGAYCRFDSASARTLRELLSAVAVYAVGGHPALEDYHRRAGRVVLRLTAPSGS